MREEEKGGESEVSGKGRGVKGREGGREVREEEKGSVG